MSYKIFAAICSILLLQACKHPLAIDGEGDIIDLNNSGYGCTLEQFNDNDAACENDVQGDYLVNYSAVPGPGWHFDHWEGSCGHLSIAPNCRFDVPAVWVAYWDSEIDVPIPALTAVFDRLTVSTNAYASGSEIPQIYTCDGDDNSPDLTWNSPPPGTQSYVVIMDDPDAQSVAGFTWVHWNLYNIPSSTTALLEGTSMSPIDLPAGATEGENDFGRVGYDGPCPPQSGGPHTYNLRIFALDKLLDPTPGSPLTIEEFEVEYGEHILGNSANYTGVYSR